MTSTGAAKTAVEVFQFPTTGQSLRTILGENGEPWFVAADVCSALDLGNVSQTVSYLDEDERRVTLISSEGSQERSTNVISEPGLYSLILRSRKPEAKAFKRWVTHDVLPAIRKTGKYEAELPRSVIAKNWYEAELKAEIEAEGKRAALARAEVAEEAVYELTPKALQADHYREADKLIGVGDFANDLALWAKETHKVKILHQQVRNYMAELGLLMRGDSIRKNLPTADAQKRDLMRIHHGTFTTKTRGTLGADSARLTTKGRDYVWDRATRRIAEHKSLDMPTTIEKRSA